MKFILKLVMSYVGLQKRRRRNNTHEVRGKSFAWNVRVLRSGRGTMLMDLFVTVAVVCMCEVFHFHFCFCFYFFFGNFDVLGQLDIHKHTQS